MSASGWMLRKKGRLDIQRLSLFLSRSRWLRFDFIDPDGSAESRKLLPLLVLALIAALCISALRIDLIRIRYAMASVVEREAALIEEQNKLIVRRRQLRDPIELAVAARARGFRPPTQVVVLREPTGSWIPVQNRVVPDQRTPMPPSVAAGPPSPGRTGDWQ